MSDKEKRADEFKKLLDAGANIWSVCAMLQKDIPGSTDIKILNSFQIETSSENEIIGAYVKYVEKAFPDYQLIKILVLLVDPLADKKED